MGMSMTPFRASTSFGAGDFILETGRLANQADGSIWVQTGDTVVLVTACTAPLPVDKGFFPLTVEYKEMAYASGQIPGSFFRREIGRPSEREVLVSRLIDRPIRPLFPEGFRDEVQIIATVLSADDVHDPDVLAMTGASAALSMSSIPFQGPIAGARIARIGGSFFINPTYEQMAESDMQLMVAASRDAVVMVEGEAEYLPETVIADAVEWAHQEMQPLLDLQEQLAKECGKEKLTFEPPAVDEDVRGIVQEIATPKMQEACFIADKMERRNAKFDVENEIKEAVLEKFPEEPERVGKVGEYLKDVIKDIVRGKIKNDGVRIDGRDTSTVRPIAIEAGVLPRAHGSAIFARGETKVLAICTLGSTRDEQRMDSIQGEATKSFMLHYNFPPYCVNEVKPLRGPGRREIGHGALAERAVQGILPDPGEFPFTIRVVSEVMESNGSSSMASVCGASLALMDAGVPVKTSIAGIAMGLIKEDDEYLVLTDILGDEDALGDMDFKIAGSTEGITAVQMDIKISGIPSDVMRRALDQARDARLHILEQMNDVLGAARPEMSPHAPQLEIVTINPEKIRDVIGPGGKNIKAITAESGASIDIEDDGRVFIFAPNNESMSKARQMVEHYDQTAELGKNYEGKVTRILDIGAVVEILPGLDGLVHISQLDTQRVEQVTDVVRLGEPLTVKVVEIESNGRLRLSRKAVIMEERGETVDLADFGKSPSRGGGRGGDRRGGGGGGDRGGRGGDRRGGGGGGGDRRGGGGGGGGGRR
jgi:polyribonucleotide nucleotidyltransferase